MKNSVEIICEYVLYLYLCRVIENHKWSRWFRHRITLKMIQTVVKRDGRVVGYNEEKIKAAIRKAMLHTELGEDESLINKITDRIGF